MSTRKNTMPPLNPLRIFVAAARHESFSATAKTLGVSQANVSRQITVLEEFLGSKLFQRKGREVQLTQTGHLYLKQVGPCFDILAAATEELLDREQESTINVCVYPTFSFKWLIPRLANFERLYPDYNVRIHTAVKPVDFSNSEFDAAIQIAETAPSDAQGFELIKDTIDVICAPSLLKDASKTLQLDELGRYKLLSARYRRDDWNHWLDANRSPNFDIQASQEYDSSILLYQAAIEGMGMAVGQIELLEDDFASGKLCCPFRLPVIRPQSYYITWPTDRHVRVKTRRFIDWVAESTGHRRQFYPNENDGSP